MKKVDIYTDGACSGNPGPGGWGAILIYSGHEKEASGYEEETTNNRMEMTAAIEALKALKESCEVRLFSDSSYLVDIINKGWIYAWLKNNWEKSNGEAVKNKDLWQKIAELMKKHKISWIKVEGHSDNEYNNRCDKIATGIIKKFRLKASDEAQ